MGPTPSTYRWVGRRLFLLRLFSLLPFLVGAILFAVAAFIVLSPGYHLYPDTEIRLRAAERTDDAVERNRAALERERHTLELQLYRHRVLEDALALSIVGSFFVAAGALLYAFSRKPPTKDVIRFAQSNGGTLTLSDVATSLNIDPRLAARALAQLQSLKIASPRWEEYRKNLWEFPDCLPAGVHDHLAVPSLTTHPALEALTRPSFSDPPAPPPILDPARTAIANT